MQVGEGGHKLANILSVQGNLPENHIFKDLLHFTQGVPVL